jgi:hypothetical protein
VGLSGGFFIEKLADEPILPHSKAIEGVMRTLGVIFALALLTIAVGIYSDAAMRSGGVTSAAKTDPATLAIAHGLTRQ